MPAAPLPKTKAGKPWRALYKGKWWDVLDVEDMGSSKQNKYHLDGVSGGPVLIEDLDMFGIAASSTGEYKMNKERIRQILTARYADKAPEALECVAADVFYSGEPESVLASGSLIDKLFERFAEKQVEVDAKKGGMVDSNEFCPLCKAATAKVLLSEGRPAKWCSRHFVVFPVKGQK